MKLKGIEISFKKLVCLVLYYGVFRTWPNNKLFLGGGQWLRYQLCKQIFKKCGKNVNVERGANFGSGRNVEIGDNSGIGVNASIPSNTIIGKDVMMGPNCYILPHNHAFDRLDIPMCQQGFTEKKTTIIEDDVWIGRDVLMTPGRRISTGTIIAGGTVLCKDFPEYSIVGGNPSKFIKNRKDDKI